MKCLNMLVILLWLALLLTSCIPTVTPPPGVTDTPTATATPFVSPIITNTPLPSPLNPEALKSPTPVPTLQSNLSNSSFEPPYNCPGSAFCVAHDWQGWYVNPPPCAPGHAGCYITCPLNCIVPATGQCSNDYGCSWQQPELGSADLPNTFRIYTGASSQKIFGYGRMFLGGVYRIVDVMPNQDYLFTIWLQAWQCYNFDNCQNGRKSDLPTTMHLKVGIDPNAGTAYDSSSIVWSAEGDAFDVYTSFAIRTRATGNRISLWVSARPDWGTGALSFLRVNNDVYLDQANLMPVNSSLFVPEVHR